MFTGSKRGGNYAVKQDLRLNPGKNEDFSDCTVLQESYRSGNPEGKNSDNVKTAKGIVTFVLCNSLNISILT